MGFIYNIGDPDTHEVLYRTYTLGNDHDLGATEAMAEANAAGINGVLLNSADTVSVDTAIIDRMGHYQLAISVNGSKHPLLKVTQLNGQTREELISLARQKLQEYNISELSAVLELICPNEMEV